MLSVNSLSRFHRLLSFYGKRYKTSFNLLSTIRVDSTTKKLIDRKPYIDLNDYKSNINTQEQLALNLSKNSFIRTSLIHFYNKMIIKSDNCTCNKVLLIDVFNSGFYSNLLDRIRFIFNHTIMKIENTTDFLSRWLVFDVTQKSIDKVVMVFDMHHYQHFVLANKQQYNRMKYLFSDQKYDVMANSKRLFNIYSSLSKYQPIKTNQVKRKKELENKVNTGKSSSETTDEVMQGQAHDKSEHQSEEIDTKLDCLAVELGKYGFEVDVSCSNRPIQEDYKRIIYDKSGHSERLALAFHFLQKPSPTFVQITNNIRICADCHHFMKLAAKVLKCEIVIRDPNCIHRFTTDGQCSCKDHF